MSSSNFNAVIRVYQWFIREFIGDHWGSLLLIGCMGAVVAGLQSAPLFIFNWVVNGGEVPDSFASYGVAGSGHYLYVAIILSILVFFVSLLIEYFQIKKVFSVWRKYQIYSVETVRKKLIQYSHRMKLECVDSAVIARSTARRSRRLGALTRVICLSITPVFRFIILLVFALYMSLEITAILMAVILLLGVAIAVVHAKKASQHMRSCDELGGAAQKELVDVINDAIVGVDTASKLDSKSFSYLRICAITNRFQEAAKARLMAGLGGAVVFLIYLWIAREQFYAGNPGQVVLHLAAMVLVLVQALMIFGTLAKIGRFYPSVNEQMILLKALSDEGDTMALKRAMKLMRNGGSEEDDED